VRLGVEFEPAFAPPVNDPALGTPFAIPTDGSSGTVDVVQIISGPLSRARFVRPSVAAGFPSGDTRIPLLPSAVATLWEPLAQATLPDDGAGNGLVARLVPVDLFDNVTDPPPQTSVTLVAGPGLRIASPDADASPSTETIPLAAAAGVDVTIDDAGIAGDGPASSRVTVLRDGLPVDELVVTLNGGGGGSTSTTTISAATTTSTTLVPGGGSAPAIARVGLTGPVSLTQGCAAHRTIWAIVTDPDADLVSATASVAVGGGAPVTVTLAPGPTSDPDIPAGARTGKLDLPASSESIAVVAFAAADLAGHTAPPVTLEVQLAPKNAPFAGTPVVTPDPIPAGRTTLTLRAHAIDDCGVQRVVVEANRGKGFRKLAKLRDDGRKGDAVAGDGVYGLTKRVKWKAGAVTFRTTVRSKRKLQTTSATTTVRVGP
jgi:hypothetical protein